MSNSAESQKVAEREVVTGQLPSTEDSLVGILEALIFSAPKPLSLEQLQRQLQAEIEVSRAELKHALSELNNSYAQRAIELVEVASGYRFQTRSRYATWVARLWQEKPQKYSRALLETLALIAYQQPITRGDIEEVRGVAVSSNIMKTLMERGWVRVVGHREVPGRPSLYATTKEFLDHFNLQALDQLPALSEVRDLDSISRDIAKQLELDPMAGDLPIKEEAKQENKHKSAEQGDEYLAD